MVAGGYVLSISPGPSCDNYGGLLPVLSLNCTRFYGSSKDIIAGYNSVSTGVLGCWRMSSLKLSTFGSPRDMYC